MSRPIAIFFHCLFSLGEPPRILPAAIQIVTEQVRQMINSGLWDAASEIHVGVNGDNTHPNPAPTLIPSKAQVTYHGRQSRCENPTIVLLENWVKTHPGWNVLYFHSKSASHNPGSSYGQMATAWRRGMMDDLVMNWRHCVAALDSHDIACSHWMWNMADGSQHIPAGNFLWITSDFAARLPSIYQRDRIKVSGIAALESRYESEVYWGNGPRPVVKQFRPNGGSGVP